MGEARRRRDARADAYAFGRLVKPPSVCPACGSRNVKRLLAAEMPPTLGRHFAEDLEVCLAGTCRTIWEAFPAEGYVEDPVCAEPCDNCAFRPGSPEQGDRDAWRALLDSLRPSDGMFSGRFYCHKGVPIDMEAGPGNFLFPRKPITMDGEILRRPSDGAPVLDYDERRMRTCSGFLRMVWALSDKAARLAHSSAVAT